MSNFIDWDKLELKKDSGSEKVKCPVCDADKQRKNDKPIQINHTDGFGKCFRCESLTFRESNKLEYTEKTYTLPVQTWKNYTKLSDNLIKWVETERKIPQHVLIELGITEENYYQPKHNKEVNNIVFNYFEGEKVVNKKYRSPSKAFTQSVGGKPIFYNINSVIGCEEVYIVEGEFDVLALRTIGIKNVISLPNGANDNDDYWKNSEKYLTGVNKFIIAVDNDEKGNDIKERIAQRLGRYRCEYIEWDEKDANDALKSLTLDKQVLKRKRFPCSGTFTAEDLREGIYDLYKNGLPKTIYPKHECFGNFKNIFSIMRGQLTTITGIPSHGKSTFSEWLALNLVNDYEYKLSLFSPEHTPMELHQTTLIQKAVGRNFWKDFDGRPRITPTDIDRYIKWADEKIYLTTPDSGDAPTWDWIFEKFKEQMYTFGVDVFIIDAFNKLLLPKGVKKDQIDEVLTRLTAFAQQNNVSVLLVAHPTKMGKGDDGKPEIPSLYSVSGSADFRNQTHNGFVIHRYFKDGTTNGYTKFINLKTKFQFQGEIGGEIDFEYDMATGRYYERGRRSPTFDMTSSKQDTQKKVFEPTIKPNSAFDWIDEPTKEIEF